MSEEILDQDDIIKQIPIKKFIQSGKAIPWLDQYNIGIPELDQQHQKLLELINLILVMVTNSSRDKDQLHTAVSGVIKYAGEHFQYEEKILKTVQCSRLNEHKKEHQMFIEEAKEIYQNFRNSFLDLRGMLDFLLSWFFKHTQGVDKKFVPIWLDHQKNR